MMISKWRVTVRAMLALVSISLGVSCTAHQEWTQPSMPAPAVAKPAPAYAPSASRTVQKHSKEVRVSHQGNARAGQMTASGEPYDPNDLTAASRTLPIGSSVVVTNPATGRSVKVRINDRGPYVHGRSLDLSKKAAESIGVTEKGVARVTVKPVDSKTVER